jgi:GTP-binding protein
MLPVIALLGRPNVGKSTLFNLLTRSRDALVADYPGLTRDRQYGYGKVGPVPYVVVDTGGYSEQQDLMNALMVEQTRKALEEADLALVLVDGRESITAVDRDLISLVRASGKPAHLVINKTEGRNLAHALDDFYSLGLGRLFSISAAHGDRVADMMDEVCAELPATEPESNEDGIRVAIVGRPNVGKSTLVNRMLGEERVLVFDQPGTTRDAISIPFERNGQTYTLIDTAGLRRRGKVHEVVEKFSAIKTLQAIERAHVVLMMVDAREGVTDQDATLIGLSIAHGRALVVAINKWDGLDAYQRDQVRRALELRLPFLGFARQHFISALHGTGVGELYRSIRTAYESAERDMSTPQLTRLLEQAVAAHPPPLVNGRRIKLRYAHQGGKRPPLVIIHGSQTERLPEAYRRYLINTFQQALKLEGTPIRIELRSGENPFAGKRNVLTPRQQAKRQRLLRHTRRSR